MKEQNFDKHKIESIDVQTLPKEHFDSRYALYKISNNKFIGQDSLKTSHYKSGKVKSKGKFARNSRGEISNLKIGEFESFYENGEIKENGKYEIGRYTQCCAGGLCSQFYNYKLGEWNYYFSNGNKKAQIIYDVKPFQLNTSCEGGDQISFGKINLDESKIYNEKGERTNPSIELINELETVLFKQGDFNTESLSIKDGKMELEFMINEN